MLDGKHDFAEIGHGGCLLQLWLARVANHLATQSLRHWKLETSNFDRLDLNAQYADIYHNVRFDCGIVVNVTRRSNTKQRKSSAYTVRRYQSERTALYDLQYSLAINMKTTSDNPSEYVLYQFGQVTGLQVSTTRNS